MKAKKSAGLLLFRKKENILQVLLTHMGGPYWENKDDGVWSIPKGEFEEEVPLDAARREVKEEIGVEPAGKFIELAPIKQGNGKIVYAWAVECDCDVTKIQSNTFSMEWPPDSGKMQTFPEVDLAAWFTVEEARVKILPKQLPLLEDFGRIIS